METSPKKPRLPETAQLILGLLLFVSGLWTLSWALLALLSRPGDWAL